jgi:hypothetical protein
MHMHTTQAKALSIISLVIITVHHHRELQYKYVQDSERAKGWN